MKTLGLLGGMSCESSAVYYQRLNSLTRDRLGGQHSAKLVMWSADFAPLSAMMAIDDWRGVEATLVDAARRVETVGAEGLLICSNTMHLMAEAVQRAIAIPVIHVADATAAAVLDAGATRPLVLATRFTMEKPFYRDRLAAAGLSPVIPDEAERERLHRIIFDELVRGRFEPGSRADVLAISRRAIEEAGADSVILGCTEFGLLVQAADFPAPMFDTTEVHARAGVAFALGGAADGGR